MVLFNISILPSFLSPFNLIYSSIINTTIYYVDSANFSDNLINSFREKYNIVTVPGFIVSKNREIEVRCDSSITENEILDMLK